MCRPTDTSKDDSLSIKGASEGKHPFSAKDPSAVSARPSWHTAILVVLLLATFVRVVPSLESIDEIANKETFLRVSFPRVLSIEQVAITRLVFAFVMVADIFNSVSLENANWTRLLISTSLRAD